MPNLRSIALASLSGTLILMAVLMGNKPTGARMSADQPEGTPAPDHSGVEAPLGKYTEPVVPSVPGLPPLTNIANGEPMPTPLTSFAGVAMQPDNNNPQQLHSPPDTHAATGARRIVEVTNGHVAIYAKDGTLLAGGDNGPSAMDLDTFCGDSSPEWKCFDPKVIYDQYADRFVAVALEGWSNANSKLHVMVSTNGNPSNLTTDWERFILAAGATIGGKKGWFDYPGLGVNPQAVVVSGNIFSDTFPFSFLGAKLRVFDKSDLYDSDGEIAFVDVDVNTQERMAFTIQPAHHFGEPPAGTFYLLQRYSDTALQVWALTNVPITPTLTTVLLPTTSQGNCINSASAPQKGTPKRIDTVCPRMMNAVWRDGSLWGTLTGSDVADTRAIVQWFEVSTTGFPGVSPTLAQQGKIDGGSGEFTYMPSISVDECGNAALVYTQSSSSRFPEIRFTGRLAGDPVGTLRNPLVEKVSVSFHDDFTGGSGAERWGDYSSTVIDPLDQSFWLAQEYVKTAASASGNDGQWGTWHTQFSFDCPSSGFFTQSLFLPLALGNRDFAVIFRDDFSSDKGWLQFEDENGAAGLLDGEYRLAYNQSGNLLLSAAPVVTASIPATYSLEVDARRISGPNTYYGLIFALQANNQFYAFLVQPGTQSYQLGKYTDTWTTLADGASPDILPGDSPNTLKVEREGEVIRIYANGSLLATVSDGALMGGRVGVALWAIEAPAEARFDNFELRHLSNNQRK